MLSLSDLVTAKMPLLPKVASYIPVFPSSYIGKCAARVLKGSDGVDTFALAIETKGSYRLNHLILTDINFEWNFNVLPRIISNISDINLIFGVKIEPWIGQEFA